MTIVATRPESSRIASDTAKAATTIIRVAATLSRPDSRRVPRIGNSRRAPPMPASRPVPREEAISTRSMTGVTPLVFREPKMTTAMIAPTGSTSTPSHFSTARTLASGAMKSRIGSTTVGPETIRIAPMRTAISVGTSNRKATATAPSSQVRTTPKVSSLITAGRTPAPSSSRLRLSAPSKRMMPTAIWTMGESESPSRACGSIAPVTETPATTPATSSGMIAGTPIQEPARRARMDSTTTSERPSRMSSTQVVPSSRASSEPCSPEGTGPGSDRPRFATITATTVTM